MRGVLLLLCLYLISHVLWANKCPKSGHSDKFSCSPCNCSHTLRGKIIVTCFSNNIQSLPKSLPPTLWKLTVLSTSITKLEPEDFLHYSNLTVVRIVHNRNLSKILGGSVINQTTQITEVDLTWNNITLIEDGSLAAMPLTRKLSLGNNRIQIINNHTFKGLSLIVQLDLSVNKIKSIEHGAFDHMTQLKILDLSRNRHLGYGIQQLSPRLFLKLKVLNTLFIQSSSNGAKEYPNEALQQLKYLETLGIDGLSYGAEFGPGMKSLKYLTHLQLGSLNKGPECSIRNITASFFDNLPRLESLQISQCLLKSLNQTALASLKSLKTFSIKLMPFYDLYWAFEDLEGLVNSKVTSLSLVNLDIQLTLCRYLNPKHAKYLQYMKLQVLDLSFNRLAYIDAGFTKLLPKSLEQLVLKGNKLTVISNIIQKVAHLDNLIGLHIGNQNVDYGFFYYTNTDSWYTCKNLTFEVEEFQTKNLPWQRCTADQDSRNDRSSCIEDSQMTDILLEDARYDLLQEDNIGDEILYMTDPGNYQHTKEHWLVLPKKLSTLRAFGFKNFGLIILTWHLCPKNNSLREINFSNSFLTHWGSGKMPPGITKANLAGNYCQKINRDFFQPNNSLVHVTLAKNYLGDDFQNDKNGSIFSELNKTVYLDLSRNLIHHLHHQFFEGLVNLETLKLSDNRLQVLNTSLSHMKSLTFLGLSKNSIIWISQSVRKDLDKIASRPGHQLKIDLTSNQLPCTCAGLEILIWMANSNICFVNSDVLECRLDNGETDYIGNLSVRVESLQRHCQSKDLIIVACVTSISFLSVLVILGLLYQNRWKIRYWKCVIMAKMFGFNPREKGEEDYKFDAYIVYTDDTTKFVLKECVQELEEKRGHKLCIEDREYLPGTDILESIVSAVQNSRKTIPIVTPDFYQHDFSEFRIKMAMMEEVYKSRSVLHLCVYQPVPEDEMSDDFLTVMKSNSYIEFPPEEHMSEEIRQTFWDQLSDVIGHTKGENVEPLLDL